jgi:hypothetical protein
MEYSLVSERFSLGKQYAQVDTGGEVASASLDVEPVMAGARAEWD